MTINIAVTGNFEGVDIKDFGKYLIDRLVEYDGDIDIIVIIDKNIDKAIRAIRNIGVDFSLVGIRAYTDKQLRSMCRFVFKSSELLDDFIAAYTDEIVILGDATEHINLDRVLKITPDKRIVFMRGT